MEAVHRIVDLFVVVASLALIYVEFVQLLCVYERLFLLCVCAKNMCSQWNGMAP